MTTHGKGQDEEKERAREGCTKGKATDPTGCRAFSDVVERSETIATENKKKAIRIRLGVAPQASHDARVMGKRRRCEDHTHGQRGWRGAE